MQSIGVQVVNDARKAKMKSFSGEIAETLNAASHHENIECPLCHYVSRNKRFSARVFVQEDGSRSFKCFSCGAWRAI